MSHQLWFLSHDLTMKIWQCWRKFTHNMSSDCKTYFLIYCISDIQVFTFFISHGLFAGHLHICCRSKWNSLKMILTYTCSLTLDFICLLTLIICESWVIRVKRQRNFILTWISLWSTIYTFRKKVVNKIMSKNLFCSIIVSLHLVVIFTLK